MKPEIVPALESDLFLLQELSLRTFHDAFAHVNTEDNMKSYVTSAFHPEKLQRELANPASKFFFCKADGNMIGYCKVNFSDAQTDIHDPKSLEIERIYVVKDYQNMKAGALLLGHCINVARQNRLDYVWLGVWEHNLRAINFYRKNGFAEIGRHDFMLGNEQQTDIIMRRAISVVAE
jgi:diamine N-acetyltransferase